MTSYIVYRDGTRELEPRIKGAMAHFRMTEGTTPLSVVVHKLEVAEATGLDLGIKITGSGGALVGEVWLELPTIAAIISLPEQKGVTTDGQ